MYMFCLQLQCWLYIPLSNIYLSYQFLSVQVIILYSCTSKMYFFFLLYFSAQARMRHYQTVPKKANTCICIVYINFISMQVIILCSSTS